MHVIAKKRLREFWALHPDAEAPLRAWHQAARQEEWRNFADVRERFPHADRVGKLTVFNVGGNKYRLIAAIHYNRGKVYVRHVLTHAEYDRGDWKEG
ncbi:MAG TPA: type II toxin-antitoxin system HigB family toxin [Gemmataceae bacterium]|jgi:mRNA interferase HigB|nr:type II toxin-antitoxin system HigB family toxin [Gemmataceae bacterium]